MYKKTKEKCSLRCFTTFSVVRKRSKNSTRGERERLREEREKGHKRAADMQTHGRRETVPHILMMKLVTGPWQASRSRTQGRSSERAKRWESSSSSWKRKERLGKETSGAVERQAKYNNLKMIDVSFLMHTRSFFFFFSPLFQSLFLPLSPAAHPCDRRGSGGAGERWAKQMKRRRGEERDRVSSSCIT